MLILAAYDLLPWLTSGSRRLRSGIERAWQFRILSLQIWRSVLSVHAHPVYHTHADEHLLAHLFTKNMLMVSPNWVGSVLHNQIHINAPS